jgi:hypothetical protein
MTPNHQFERKLESLALDLFEPIPSQTTRADKRALLAIQRAIRNLVGEYVYLEIGSYIGGSIQTHLLDPKCRLIYSIDNRPYSQPDERGIEQIYPENSTQNMLDRLKTVAPDQLQKLICFESRAQDIDRLLISEPPHICFIDGEHTDNAVVQDFEFCLSVADPNGMIVFHDADLIYKGIKTITDRLTSNRIRFRGAKLSGSVYIIGLGSCRVWSDDRVKRLVQHAGLYFFKSHLKKSYMRCRYRRRAHNASG